MGARSVLEIAEPSEKTKAHGTSEEHRNEQLVKWRRAQAYWTRKELTARVTDRGWQTEVWLQTRQNGEGPISVVPHDCKPHRRSKLELIQARKNWRTIFEIPGLRYRRPSFFFSFFQDCERGIEQTGTLGARENAMGARLLKISQLTR